MDQVISHATPAWAKRPAEKVRARYMLRIEPCKLEIAPGVVIDTIGYNGQVPSPVLRVREGVPVTIDVTNQTGHADIVHWHGHAIDSLNDGAMEEGSPMIPAGGTLRYHFTPRPAGTRWYHTHAAAGANLSIGTYTGQFGFLMVENGQDPGRYDQEIFLAIHHWEPALHPAPLGVAAGHDAGAGFAQLVRLAPQLVQRGLQCRVQPHVVEGPRAWRASSVSTRSSSSVNASASAGRSTTSRPSSSPAWLTGATPIWARARPSSSAGSQMEAQALPDTPARVTTGRSRSPTMMDRRPASGTDTVRSSTSPLPE